MKKRFLPHLGSLELSRTFRFGAGLLGFAALPFSALGAGSEHFTASSSAGVSVQLKDAAITPTERVNLVDSKGPVGWTFLLKPSTGVTGELWQVKGDEWRFPAGFLGYFRTEKSYAHYHLHVEWTYPEKLGNSGIFVAEDLHDAFWPHSYQINLKTGSAGDLLAQGDLKFSDGTKTLTKKNPANEKAVGEWNSCDIICDGPNVTVTLNGVLQNQLSDAPSTEGCIGLQLESAAIAFRNVWIEPVAPKS